MRCERSHRIGDRPHHQPAHCGESASRGGRDARGPHHLHHDPPRTSDVAIPDAATFEVRGRIRVGAFQSLPGPVAVRTETILNRFALPHGVALNRAGTRLYVGVEWSEVSGLVVCNVLGGAVIGKIDLLLEGGPFLAVNRRADKLDYPHRDDNRVVVIDTRTDEIVKIIEVPGAPSASIHPDGEAWVHSDYDGPSP